MGHGEAHTRMARTEIRRTGPKMADVVQGIRDVPARVIPYAAATALTKAAKHAQKSVIADMRVSFDRPTAYTLNATRIEPATKDKLFARLAVKDDRPGGGTRPESFLLPEVRGGGRNEKGFERALRTAGVLRAGERAMPGAGVQRDASGNVSGATVRSILKQVARPGGAQRRGAGSVFAGAVGRQQTRGVWQRDGRRLRPLFVFTTRLPHYSAALDFNAAAERAVRENFATDFYAAAAAIRAKRA